MRKQGWKGLRWYGTIEELPADMKRMYAGDVCGYERDALRRCLQK
jgi:hypothetical protein